VQETIADVRQTTHQRAIPHTPARIAEAEG
jgi:hypothetical protein